MRSRGSRHDPPPKSQSLSPVRGRVLHHSRENPRRPLGNAEGERSAWMKNAARHSLAFSRREKRPGLKILVRGMSSVGHQTTTRASPNRLISFRIAQAGQPHAPKVAPTSIFSVIHYGLSKPLWLANSGAMALVKSATFDESVYLWVAEVLASMRLWEINRSW